MENRRKRKQRGKKPANNIPKQVERTHINLDDFEVPQVVEPRPNCAICGQVIESFAEAISEPDGAYSHFDCVLDKIRQQENVQAPDTVSYIGHGTFAVVTKDAEGKYTIKTRIPYESNEAFLGMKKQVEVAKQ
jgi:transcription elongation factor Elf1